MLNIRLSQDLCAALVFILIGGSTLWFGRDLDPGTAANMGPGYVPRALGWMIFIMGVFTALRGLRLPSPALGRVNLRPLVFILGSVLLFALMVDPFGFIPASVIAVFVALFAMERPSFAYAAFMSILLPLAMTVVFIFGLGLPIDLWWF